MLIDDSLLADCPRLRANLSTRGKTVFIQAKRDVGHAVGDLVVLYDPHAGAWAVSRLDSCGDEEDVFNVVCRIPRIGSVELL